MMKTCGRKVETGRSLNEYQSSREIGEGTASQEENVTRIQGKGDDVVKDVTGNLA